MFDQVVGRAVAYLDLDTSKFNTGLQTAWNQLKGIGDQSLGLDQKLQSVGSGLQTVGSSLTKSVTLPLAGAFTLATKKTMDFEESMSNVKALSGAAGEEFDALREKALDLGGSTKFTSKEVADAFSYMALAGWNTEQMLDGITGVLDLAASSNMDLARASDIVTDYLSAYGMEAKDAAHMSDMMAYAQANANTTTEMLGDAFGNSASFMHTAGQEMNTTIALLSAMANQGLKGSEAGTALSAVMRDIVQNMDEGKIAIGDVDVAVMDSEGNFRDLTDILADVEKAVYGLGDAEKTSALMTTFTSRSIKGLGTILTEGSDSIKSFRDQLDQADGTANEISKTMLDNLAGSITYLTSALDNFLIKVGDRLAPYIRKFADWLTEITNKLTSMSDEEFDNMVKIGLWVAAAGPMLSILGKLFSVMGSIVGLLKTVTPFLTGIVGHIGTIGSAIGKIIGFIGQFIGKITGIGAVIGGAILAVKNFFDMWENGWNLVKTILEAIGLALAAIGAVLLGAPALVAGIVAGIIFVLSQLAIVIHDHWDEIKQWAKETWEHIQEGWEGFKKFWIDLWESIVNWFKEVWQGITEWFGEVVEGIKEKWDGVKEWFRELWENIVSTMKEIWNGIIEWFREVIDGIKKTWEEFKEWITGLWEKIVKEVSEKIKEIFDSISNFLQDVWKAVTEFFSNIWDAVTTSWDNLIKGITEFFKTLWGILSGWFKDIWNGIVEFFDNLVKGIGEWFANVGKAIESAFESVRTIVDNVIQAVEEAWNGFVEFIQNIFGKVIDFIQGAVETLVNWVKDVGEKIGSFFDGIIKTIGELWENITSFIGDVFEKIFGFVQEKLKSIWEWVKEFPRKFIDIGKGILENLWNGLKSAWEPVSKWFEDKFGWISDIVDKIRNGWNEIKGKISGGGYHSYANGLDYVPYDNYVANLHKGERVLTKSENEQYNKGYASGSTGGDTFNFYNTQPDPYEYARQMKRAKKELLYT